MRLLRWCLTGLLATALGLMWTNRAVVVDAYTQDPEPLDFQLDGFSLEGPDIAPLGPSPYLIPVPPDTGRVVLPVSFPASTPPGDPASLLGGSAALGGTVLGPTGVVPNAMVRVERHTVDGLTTLDLVADEFGVWTATNLVGGRYRLRAFVPGELASESVAVFFLAAEARQIVETPVIEASSNVSLHFFGPTEILQGTSATVAVSSQFELVDDEGRVVLSPLPSAIMTAALTGPVSLLSGDLVVADATGAARFLIACDGVGSAALTVTSGEGKTTSFVLPPCVAPPPPEPTGVETLGEEPVDG